jgi:hypothetical protein
MLRNMTVPPDPERDERAVEDEELAVDPDESADTASVEDDAVDAIAALHEAGGDADRAETLLESARGSQSGEPVPDDERPT